MPTRAALFRIASIVLCCLAISASSRQATAAADLIPTLSIAVNGTTVEYSVTICSMMGPSGAFITGLYYDRASAPGCGDTPDVEISFPNLQGESCLTEVHTQQDVPPGEMSAWAFADSRCLVSEKTEDNNLTSQDYAVGPDLAIAELAIAAVNGEVSFTVEVENHGVATDGPFLVGLYLDRATAPSCADSPDVTLTFAALGLSQRASQSHLQSGVAAGSFRAWALADQGCTVTERDEENNAAAQTYDVGPNLYVYNPTISVAGSTVTYGVEVCAWEASADSGPYSVGLWYDLAAAPACGASGADHLWSEEQLPLGSCQTLSHSRNAAPPGDYTAHFFGDPGCLLAESREGDNQRSRVYAVGALLLPDLYISGLTATVSGSDVYYQADLCNQGAGASTPVAVDLFFDGATAPPCNGNADHRWSVGALSPGLCQSLTYTQAGASPGTRRAWVMADAACQQDEQDEANNVSSASYTVGQPDLSASALSASISGSQVTFNGLVCNEGTAVLSDFTVGLFYNRHAAPQCSQNPDFSTVVSGLQAGACQPVTAFLGAAGPGEKTAWLFVDSLCQLVEGDELNNVLEHRYVVGGAQPDLRITSFTAQPDADQVSFATTICNNGSRPAPAFELGIYYNRASEPGCGESPDYKAAVTGLAAGECLERTHALQGVSGGAYRAWAKADVACQVGESNEDNNAASQTYVVEALVMDLQVTSLTASGAGPLTFMATICNSGSRATPETVTGLYHDRTEMPSSHCGDIPDQQTALAALEAGQCVNQSWVLAEVPPGEHQAWVVADVACSLMEPDETNNLASYAYSGSPPGDAGGIDATSPADAGPLPDTGLGKDASKMEDEDPAGGCSCRQGSSGRPHGTWLLILLAASLWRRRRRPDRRSKPATLAPR